MGESSIASARASVMIYDDVNKKWIPSGSSSGLSKVHIYQHLTNNTFRVVGRKLQDTNEVVINCAILKGLKYNQATSTFHQWRDNRQVYGLNFSSREDADRFADAMLRVLDTLVNSSTGTLPSARSQQQHQQQGMYGHVGGHTVNNEYLEINQVMRQQQGPMGNGWPNNDQTDAGRLHQQQMQAVQEREMNMMNSISHPPPPPAAPQMGQQQIPPQTQQQMLQHRSPPSSNTGPGMMPIPNNTGPGMMPIPNHSMAMQPAVQYQMPQTVVQAPPAPPMSSGAPPPPPPPPPPGGLFGAPNPPPLPSGNSMNNSVSNAMTGTAGRSPASNPPPQPPAMSNLASALANAKLKKTPGKDSDRDSTGSGGGGTTASSAPMGGMASMMDEMAKTLARRRAQAEGNGESKIDGNKSITNGSSPNKEDSSSSRFRSGSTEGAHVNGNSVDSFDVEKLKHEILSEIKKELAKTKMEIIEAIRMELNRR